MCEKNILLLKATPRAKTIKIHTNRVRLFNHLIDVVTDPVPAAEITKEEITAPIASEDNNDDSDIFDEQHKVAIPPLVPPPLQPEPEDQQPQPAAEPIQPILLQRQEGQWRLANPVLQPAPVLQPNPVQPARPALGPLDQLAVELFRHTRSRGTVDPIPPTPFRPPEYKRK